MTPTCTKVPHATRAEAVRHARTMMQRLGQHKLHAYKCPRCPCFHIGRDAREGPERRKNKIALDMEIL